VKIGLQPNPDLTFIKKNEQTPTDNLEQQVQKKLFRESLDLSLTLIPAEKSLWGQDIAPKRIDAKQIRHSLHSLIRKRAPFVRKYKV
jgi:hypothetical protein